jgi:hypothetical protein
MGVAGTGNPSDEVAAASVTTDEGGVPQAVGSNPGPLLDPEAELAKALRTTASVRERATRRGFTHDLQKANRV